MLKRIPVRRYPGMAVGALSGLVVGFALLFGALYQKIPIYGVEFFGILIPLTLFGLLYDVRLGPLVEGPNYWRDTVVYWSLVYPVVRALYDLGLYLSIATHGRMEPLFESFPYYAGPLEFSSWVIFQAVFGSAYGIGFLILHSRLRKSLGRSPQR